MAHRIVIVDDDTAIRRVLTRILTRAGYRVVACDNAADALANLGSDDGPAVLVTDLVMPGIAGDELVEIVHRRWPHVPRIIMSGNILPDSTCGATWLLKPFGGAQLIDAVARCVELGTAAAPVSRS